MDFCGVGGTVDADEEGGVGWEVEEEAGFLDSISSSLFGLFEGVEGGLFGARAECEVALRDRGMREKGIKGN